MKVFSPMVTGSGAWIIHEYLSTMILDYRIKEIAPNAALFSPGLKIFKPKKDEYEIYHSAPDLGAAIIPDDAYAVLTFHNFYYDDFMLKHSSFAQRCYYLSLLKYSISRACQRADQIVCVSNFIGDLVLTHFPQYKYKLSVIKNGIDTEQFKLDNGRKNDDKIKILFSGNPTKRKGVQFLLQLADSLPENCILQCTSGSRDLNVVRHPKIDLMGNIPHENMPAIYQQADVLFLPTLREGLSLVTLEAMSCGLPVVTTNKTSQEELIEDKKGGFLSDINDFEQMFKSLTLLSKNKSLRKEMGAFNRDKVLRSFDGKRMANEYQSLFFNNCQ